MSNKSGFRMVIALALAAAVTVSCAGLTNPLPIATEEVTYQSGGVTMKGYLAKPTSPGTHPGVLVVHEWWGHNDYARRRARMLAELGYCALAVDMYGDGKQAEHPEDAQRFVMEVTASMATSTARFAAAKDLLAADPATDPDRIAAIGYCFGGAVVLHMARTGMDLDGVASFHGNLATQSPAKRGAIHARLLVLHGGDDSLIPAAQVEAFKQEMAAADADLRFVAYPGAKHAFTNRGADEKARKYGLPLGYDEDADTRSWAELTAFLATLWD